MDGRMLLFPEGREGFHGGGDVFGYLNETDSVLLAGQGMGNQQPVDVGFGLDGGQRT
jgi:hypothetical protein